MDPFEDLARITNQDQANADRDASMKLFAGAIASYHRALTAEGLDEDLVAELVLDYQRTLLMKDS